MSPAPNEPESKVPEPPVPASAPPAPEQRRTDRTLLAILAVIAMLVVVSVIVVFTRGRPALVAENTPAGVVQRYSAAVIDGDEAAADAYLTDAAGSRCSGPFEPAETGNLRVTLVATTERPASADVRVLITVSTGGGPFGSAEDQIDDAFDLVKTGGKWLIRGAPWQLTLCRNTEGT
ncbi:hypothetical protein [Arthrobacter sp. H16F315]|uniref:hypothetical protein n=1 Tax=Arthrobacter sp. H16F315 TaxID=2955314 RepID=UPI002096A577|nr:hypothetical protein [Arthrobacter sp. H16F315]MDD1477415.1 hypothetical protein [Arthrobacter sp. H16F315]